MAKIELNDLCGMHKLSGVDMCETSFTDYCGDTETVSAIRFILDEVTYEAVEDPSDGYRSYMNELRTTDEKVRYTFPPVDVLCSMSEEEGDEVLCFRDTGNGKTILEVGTKNTNDYYPFCAFEWTPENMVCNENEGEKIEMTCYDCIHCGACSDAGDPGISYLKDDVSKCKHFKHKDAFTEVKHGEWVRNEPNPKLMKEFHDMGIGKAMTKNSIYWTCSCCGTLGNPHYEYCPHCSAIMDGTPKEGGGVKVIGNNIERLMKENGYTQKQLAMRLQCTQAAISRYVSNEREPSVRILKNLAIALGVTVDELIKD